MTTEKKLVNRVASSGLITFKPEEFFPPEPIVVFDLKDFLFQGLLLKEKDFRLALKDHNWQQYEGKYITVHCSTDAIIPVWAYMLVTVMAEPFAISVFFGSKENFLIQFYREKLLAVDWKFYQDKMVVVKGCSDYPIPAAAYLEIARLLRPFAKSIMFGEPCSTVPVYKKK